MTNTTREVIDKNIQNMFVELADEYDLPNGDFSPQQELELDDIKERLGGLLGDYVHNNIPESEEV